MGGASGVRLAGRIPLAGGGSCLWSVADGRRGRRWRSERLADDGRSIHTLLLETGPDLRLSRLEAASPAGLLTVHPDAGSSTLHGNVVRPSGVDHLALPWSLDHVLLALDEPLLVAACLGRLRSAIRIGDSREIRGLRLEPASLGLSPGAWSVARASADRWHLRDLGTGRELLASLDPDGLLAFPGGLRWPLER